MTCPLTFEKVRIAKSVSSGQSREIDSDLIFRRAVISRDQTPHPAWLLHRRGTGGKDHRGLSLPGPKARPLAAWGGPGAEGEGQHLCPWRGGPCRAKQAELSFRGYLWRLLPMTPNKNGEAGSKSMALLTLSQEDRVSVQTLHCGSRL